jgi:hypothetical protein
MRNLACDFAQLGESDETRHDGSLWLLERLRVSHVDVLLFDAEETGIIDICGIGHIDVEVVYAERSTEGDGHHPLETVDRPPASSAQLLLGERELESCGGSLIIVSAVFVFRRLRLVLTCRPRSCATRRA